MLDIKKISPLFFGIIIAIFVSCNNGKVPVSKMPLSNSQMHELIKEKETLLKSDLTNQKNKPLAEELVKIYTDFVTTFPKDTLCPEYLFKAADVSRGLGRALHAVELYVKLIDKYPNSEKAPLALFLQGFIFDNELNDDKKAAELYESFIKKYPNNKFVKDAEFSIKNLGKSDEQLIEEFEKNQSKNKV